MSAKSVFPEASSPEMTSQSFSVSYFGCTPPKVKFHVFGTSKHGDGKSLSNLFFAILISTLWRFYRANKKVCHIHFEHFIDFCDLLVIDQQDSTLSGKLIFAALSRIYLYCSVPQYRKLKSPPQTI